MIDSPAPHLMVERLSPDPVLRPYPCTGWNKRTHKPCTATVVDAWAPAGAILRRRCNDCGTWQVVRVQPESTNT